MDELTIGDKIYISSKRAAKITGYAKDYVGQLCREGRVEARLVGRNWYVLESSIKEHRFGVAEEDGGSAEAQKEPEDRPYQWASPTYVAESPVQVPSLIKRDPEVLASRKVVSEMQAAWQEWFAQQPAATTLEETMVDSDSSGEVSGVRDEEEVAFTAVYEEESLPSQALVQSETATNAYEVPEVREYSYSAMTEVMDLSRAHEPEVVVEAELPSEEYEAHEDEYQQQGGGKVVRALLVGSALVASVVALVGTGVVGDTFLKSYGKESELGKAIQYLGGESEYTNSSK